MRRSRKRGRRKYGGKPPKPTPKPKREATPAPILALGLHLQPLEFVLAASYRLGLPLYRVEGASPTCPACHQPADIYGIHAMNCGTGGERIHRHTLLVDVVHQVAAAAQLAKSLTSTSSAPSLR